MKISEFMGWVVKRNRYDAESIGSRMTALECDAVHLENPRLLPNDAAIGAIADTRAPSNAGHLLNGALGMTTESAELLDMVKKVVVHGKPLDADMHCKMVLEVGDALHYAALICDALDIDFQYAINCNVEKLEKRDRESPDHYGGKVEPKPAPEAKRKDWT